MFQLLFNYEEIKYIRENEIIAFDLDNTLITTIFTNENVNDKYSEVMYFYKKSTYDNRYSVLRPGIKELLELLKKKEYKLALITDASYKRASTILKQFGFCDVFDFVLSREILSEVVNVSKLNRRIKPYNYIGYKCLIDDYTETIEYNGEKCIPIKPFTAKYIDNKIMIFDKNGICLSEYFEEFDSEKEYIMKIYFDILKVLN
ncbi:MAG: HAD hydrolase-like protein [Lachnospiraceae bacterium]|nr:HAD hydrolase-like protein [Lachnospiraceae bacterium]